VLTVATCLAIVGVLATTRGILAERVVDPTTTITTTTTPAPASASGASASGASASGASGTSSGRCVQE
jgi:hypothetical protein